MASKRTKGTLIIIGGGEDKEGDKLILREVARRVGNGKLVVATVASEEPQALWESYEPIFRRLGVRHVWHLAVESREEAKSERAQRIMADATAVFFTGGDQLRLTSQLGDSPVYQRTREIYEAGGLIAGTSAGASMMTETMLVSGGKDESPRIGSLVRMAPGLSYLPGVVVDQHFGERGRMTRLIGAVAQNPRIIGIGIDENTAIVVEDCRFTVLGEGAVYVVDARGLTYSNLAEEDTGRALSAFGICVNMLSQGDQYDLSTDEPTARPAEDIEDKVRESA